MGGRLAQVHYVLHRLACYGKELTASPVVIPLWFTCG
jgi:hypothetical protein